MKPLSPDALRALRAYRQERGVPPAVRARLLAHLESSLREGPSGSPMRPLPGRGLRLLRWAGPLAMLVAGLGWSLRPDARPERDAVRMAQPDAVAPPRAALPPAAGADAPQAAPPQLPAWRQRAHDERGEQRVALRKAVKRSSSGVALERARAAQPAAAPVATPPTLAVDHTPDDTRALPASPSQAPHAWEGAAALARERQREVESPRPALSLDDEVMLLRRVSDHLLHGDPMRAMSALSEHARLFPDGKLVAMRKAARVRALCELGKRAEAEREAAQFLAQYSDSPYAAQVRRGCR